ncbi:olfactory receptor 13C9-like [Gastrophryne carolinensis]
MTGVVVVTANISAGISELHQQTGHILLQQRKYIQQRCEQVKRIMNSLDNKTTKDLQILAFLSEDISYTTVTVPKLLDMLLSGNNSISFIECLTQMFFFTFIGSIEVILLTSMAYDRYVAICKPLQYHVIMNKKNCVWLLVGVWFPGCLNSALVTVFASRVPLCYPNQIQQFFCNVKSVAQIFCPSPGFDALIYMEVIILGLCPFLLSVCSYVKIIKIILGITSANGRRKTFSTCTSHLTVLLIFYGTVIFMHMKPTSQCSDDLDQVFSVLYASIAPMLNPLIYSLRNKEVTNALLQLAKIRK